MTLEIRAPKNLSFQKANVIRRVQDAWCTLAFSSLLIMLYYNFTHPNNSPRPSKTPFDYSSQGPGPYDDLPAVNPIKPSSRLAHNCTPFQQKHNLSYAEFHLRKNADGFSLSPPTPLQIFIPHLVP